MGILTEHPYPLLFAVRDTLMTMTGDSLTMREYSQMAHAIVALEPEIDGYSPKAVHRAVLALAAAE